MSSDNDKGCSEVNARAWADPFNDGVGMAASAWREKVIVQQGPFTVEYYEIGTFVPQGFPNICGGYNNLYASTDLAIYPTIESNNPKHGYAQLKAQDIIFDNESRVIIVKGISGGLAIDSDDIANDFTAFVISVTNEPESYVEPVDEQTEVKAYLNNLIWSANAILNNGSLTLNKNFQTNHFTFTKEQSSNATTVSINIDELKIPVPEEYDMDALVVNIGSDAGNLGYGISEKFRIRNVENTIQIKEPIKLKERFEFLNYPNPVSSELNIQVELPYDTDGTIALYDINGDIVDIIYDGFIKANEPIRVIKNIEALKPNSVYFLRLFTNQKTYVRKVLIMDK